MQWIANRCVVVLAVLFPMYAMAHQPELQWLCCANKDGKYGYIDKKGVFVIPSKYDYATEFNANGVAYCLLDGTNLLLHADGTEITFPRPSTLPVAATEAWNTNLKTKCRMLRIMAGYFAIPCSEEILLGMFPNHSKQGETWIVFDMAGKLVSNQPFEAIGSYSDNCFSVRKEGKWGGIDSNGKLLIPFLFEDIKNYSHGVAFVKYGGKWGVVSSSGKWICEPKFLYVYEKGDTSTTVAVLGKTDSIFVDGRGHPILQKHFAAAHPFQDGLAAVAIHNPIDGSFRWGFINLSGELVISADYEQVRPFSEGLAGVLINGKWGFINHSGDIVVPPVFSRIENFTHGLACVWPGDNPYYFFYINTNGEVVHTTSNAPPVGYYN